MGLITIRLPKRTHKAIRSAAEKHGTSMNAILCLLAERYLREACRISSYTKASGALVTISKRPVLSTLFKPILRQCCAMSS